MFCKNCGSQIDDKAVICPHCGVAVRGSIAQSEGGNTMAIVGFILSFFVAIAGLICSIIGYKKSKNEGAPHKGFALAGIIISSVSMALAVIIVFSTFALACAAISMA